MSEQNAHDVAGRGFRMVHPATFSYVPQDLSHTPPMFRPYLPSLLTRSASTTSIHRPGIALDSGPRRASYVVLHRAEVRSDRLIGSANPRYEWDQYRKT